MLLITSLWVAGLRLLGTKWTPQLDKVEFALMVGVIFGIVLGYSSFNSKTSRWIGAAFSITVLSWQLSLLLPNNIKWAEKVSTLSERTWLSLTLFVRNEPFGDTTLFMILMIVSYWFLGLLAGYLLTRTGKPWWPLAIVFAALLIIDYYPPYLKSRYIFSGLFVFLSLLLLGRLYFLQSQRKWKTQRALVDYGTDFDFARSIALVGFILVFISWGIPSIIQLLTPGSVEQQKFVKFWEPLQERFSNAVAGLQTPRTTGSDFFGKNLALGTEISQDETPVFQVEVSRERSSGFRYYWRGHGYDSYENGVWTNTIDESFPVEPSEWPLERPDWTARKWVELTYHWQFNRSRIMYVPGVPISISRPIRILGKKIGVNEIIDSVALIASTSIYDGESFEAQAWVSVPTTNQLQDAGDEYPVWVQNMYFQLPEDLPERFFTLAEEITGELETPYEKATAITEYIRDEIQYEGKIDIPPEGAEPLDWFLFESKKGYCNYYASAEVILLRTQGIPARLVVGFVEGEKIAESKVYQVELKDSHAWPEVYFPGIGWVEFEPTVIRPQPKLITEQDTAGQESTNPDGVESFYDQYGGPFGRRFEDYLQEGIDLDIGFFPRYYAPIQEWLILFCVAVLIGLIFWGQKVQQSEEFDRRLPVLLENILRKRGLEVPRWIHFWAYRSTLTPIEKSFMEISWMLRLLREEVKPAHTPLEQITFLVKLLPEAKEPAEVLLGEYHLSIYSPYQGDLQSARVANAKLWWQVSQTWFARLIRR
ncbi:MAG: transglutaminase-like domain-containing protein [Anaerolineaceae bacterium]|nr:transglutaminase-like domain-containing protein [Anaerolineaceae bacterium]